MQLVPVRQKSGGLVTAVGDDVLSLMEEVEPGMTIQVGTENFFVGYRAPDVGGVPQIYISPSPDDNHATPRIAHVAY